MTAVMESQSAMQPGYATPYAGLKVLDISQGIAGPYCGMLLAQYGAQVIKVEPHAGDWARALGQRVGDHTALDLTANRGKRSIAIDLKPVAGRALAQRLAAGCDVLIENFRPGVMDRLGLGYERLRGDNPRLIYLSVSAFGQHGPGRDRPGSDTVLQAFSGMMSINRDASGTPRPTGFLTVDYVTGLYAFQALAAALAGRAFEAEGRHLDVSLMQSAGAFLSAKFIEERVSGGNVARLNAPAGSYRTSDGWIAVTLTKEAHFPLLCKTIGRAQLAEDARFADFTLRSRHLSVLAPLVQEGLLAKTTAEWLELFHAADVLASPIHDMTSWIDDAQVEAMDVVAEACTAPGAAPIPWVKIPGADCPGPEDPRSRWPDIGADAAAILRDTLDMTDAEIEALVQAGVVLGATGQA